jgi:PAS domain S-box-containing protein
MIDDTKARIQLLDEVRSLRQQEAEWKHRYEEALQATGQVLYDWQAQTNALIWAGAAEQLLGYSLVELPTTWAAIRALLHPADRAAFDQEMAHAQATQRGFQLTYRLRRKDGVYRTVEDRGRVCVDRTGAVVRRVGGLIDITERKEAELALYIDKATAEAANRAKSEFLATLSHELRTPLGVILGYAELLLENSFGALQAEQVRPLRGIDRSARELLDLITAVFDLSRLEAGCLPLARHETGVAELLQELQTETQQLQERARLPFVWDIEPALPQLYTDSGKLKIVLKNLLNNALKFTKVGHITVAARSDKAGVEFRVQDTGIGIPQEALGLIFEPFRQLENAVTLQSVGTGLGLHIAKQLLGMLDGRITVESEVGRGTTFCVWLPQRQEQSGAKGPNGIVR